MIPADKMKKRPAEPKNEIRILSKEIMCISNLLRRNVEASGIKKTVDKVTNMHGYIIGFLYHNRDRDIFQKDIEEMFSYRRSTASSVMGLMEEKNLIERVSVPYDARLKKIVLTPEALKLAVMIDDDRESLERRMSDGVAKEELESFYTVLDKIKHNLEGNEKTKEGGNQ